MSESDRVKTAVIEVHTNIKKTTSYDIGRMAKVPRSVNQ